MREEFRNPNRCLRSLGPAGLALGFVCLGITGAFAQARKPNILLIFGDDIGQANISAYTHGLMGYKTPNIDCIAREGIMFTDYYAENSCTAGRSSFITGQTPKRTGLSKVGIPGALVGLQARDVTIAQALKPLGYATGQFGKNHLGDRDEFLPTNSAGPTLPRRRFAARRTRTGKAPFACRPWSGGRARSRRARFTTASSPALTGFPRCWRLQETARSKTAYNLRMDPYERADIVSDPYDKWRVDNAYLMGWMVQKAAPFLETFVKYPPSQPPASFTIDQIQKDVDRQIQESSRKAGRK